MGLRDRFFGPPDPASLWTSRPGTRFVCTLDELSFSGLRLGDPVEAISRFGAPENAHPTREGMYDYPSQGFEIDATDGRVDGFLFRWDAMDPARHFRGRYL